MVQAKGQFKRRSTANNVEIIVPVPADADSPRFRVTSQLILINVYQICHYSAPIGKSWISQVPPGKECSGVEHKDLPRECDFMVKKKSQYF